MSIMSTECLGLCTWQKGLHISNIFLLLSFFFNLAKTDSHILKNVSVMRLNEKEVKGEGGKSFSVPSSGRRSVNTSE